MPNVGVSAGLVVEVALNETVFGELFVLLAKESVAVLVPVAEGENVSVTVQVPETATVCEEQLSEARL